MSFYVAAVPKQAAVHVFLVLNLCQHLDNPTFLILKGTTFQIV